MPIVALSWTPVSKSQFDELQQRAIRAGRFDDFIRVHNEIVTSLRDLEKSLELGELRFHTRKAGGEVRHWIHEFISVNYVSYRHEHVGVVLKYQSMPSSWPE